ncbi:hypothetical protein PSEUDT2_04164 [Stutzerimonas stutzeri]|uniref:hypothetical protein n=1 Tax=Stutzerimonas stutzeri TaxID=316 RepID=UPI0016448075|nr:hypothetical protein [Stutzerimonas stutzeri]CAD2261518.1 hypothetical protein PSEUDT2_04164 [Stutzerimonas stutzeri]
MKYTFKTQLLACASALVATLTVAACTASNPVATAAGTLVSRYCAAPEIGRSVLREAIATSTAPNRIRVECADDAF